MKRKWTYAPAWVDYTVQTIIAIECGIRWLEQKLLPDKWSLLDRYCQCPQCQLRRKHYR